MQRERGFERLAAVTDDDFVIERPEKSWRKHSGVAGEESKSVPVSAPGTSKRLLKGLHEVLELERWRRMHARRWVAQAGARFPRPQT